MPSVLFLPSLGKGFGHVKRALLISQALKHAEPSLSPIIVIDSILSRYLNPCDSQFLVLPPRISSFFQDWITNSCGVEHYDFAAAMHEIIKGLCPNMVVYDLALSQSLVDLVHKSGGLNVLVLRRQKLDRLSLLLSSRLLDSVDKIIIPHCREEFSQDDTTYASRSTNVGHIVSEPDVHLQASIRSQLAVPGEAFWVVATIGGGGYSGEWELLVELISHTASILFTQKRPIVFSVFSGPYNPYPLPASSSNLRWHCFNPSLGSWLGAADFVVSFGGYNSALEILQSGRPALLIPRSRELDDQFARVQGLSKYPDIHTIVDQSSSSTHLAQLILQYANQQTRCQRLRPAKSTGSDSVARELLGLLKSRDSHIAGSKNDWTILGASDVGNINASFLRLFSSGRKRFYIPRTLASESVVQQIGALEDSLSAWSCDVRFRVGPRFDGQVLSHPRDAPMIQHVNLRITEQCGSQCVYCYHWRSQSSTPHMDMVKVLDVAYQARDLGAVTATINGGEPSLHPRFIDILDSLARAELRVSVNTNGKWLLSPRRRGLILANRSLTLVVTLLSLSDVGLRGVQDWTPQVLTELPSVCRTFPNVTVKANIVITSANVNQVTMLAKRAIDAGVKHLHMNLVDNVRDVDNSALFMSETQVERLYARSLPVILCYAERNNARVTINPLFRSTVSLVVKERAHPQIRAALELFAHTKRHVEEIRSFAAGAYGRHFYCSWLKYCGVPRRAVYVMANGDVFPCVRSIGGCGTSALGNMFSSRLGTILSSEQWQLFAANAGRHRVCETCNNEFERSLREAMNRHSNSESTQAGDT